MLFNNDDTHKDYGGNDYDSGNDDESLDGGVGKQMTLQVKEEEVPMADEDGRLTFTPAKDLEELGITKGSKTLTPL